VQQELTKRQSAKSVAYFTVSSTCPSLLFSQLLLHLQLLPQTAATVTVADAVVKFYFHYKFVACLCAQHN